MPRLKYLKMPAQGGAPLRVHLIVPTVDAQENAFRRWHAWKSRHDSAPLPDWVTTDDDARAYRDYLRVHDAEPEPSARMQPVVVIERLPATVTNRL